MSSFLKQLQSLFNPQEFDAEVEAIVTKTSTPKKQPIKKGISKVSKKKKASTVNSASMKKTTKKTVAKSVTKKIKGKSKSRAKAGITIVARCSDCSNREKRLMPSVAEPHHAFWFKSGHIAHDLSELYEVLAEIDTDTFNHHVTAEKNDMADWVCHVFGDNGLCQKLQKTKSQRQTRILLKKHLTLHYQK